MSRNFLRSGYICLLFSFAIASIFLGRALGYEIADSKGDVTGISGSVGSVFGISIGLFLLGVAFYALKVWNRLLYGALKAVLALGSIVYAGRVYYFGTPESDFSLLSLLPWFATVYIFVRGLDNIGEGLKDQNGGERPRFWALIFPAKVN